MSSKADAPGRIYIWEWPVRFSHWFNALLITTMFATGLYIGWPLLSPSGEAYANATMAWVRYIHFLCGFLFLANGIFRLYWFFAGNSHAKNIFRFWEKRSWKSIWQHTKELTLAESKIHQEFPEHDQFARFWHSLFFLACFFMVFTGFALYGEADPHSWSYLATRWGWWFFGTSRSMHYWHHLVAWFFPFFVVAHVYQVARIDILAHRGMISSIVGGFYLNWTKEDKDREKMKRRVVVLGVGNPLYHDDGFGIEAVAAFGRLYPNGPGFEVIDAGTEGLALLGYVEDTTDLVILDVVEGSGLVPGDLVEYDAAYLASGVPLKLSQHQVGVEEVLGLAAWRGRLPERSVLLGVVPSSLEFGLGLSEPVASAMSAVVERAAEVLRGWGALGLGQGISRA